MAFRAKLAPEILRGIAIGSASVPTVNVDIDEVEAMALQRFFQFRQVVLDQISRLVHFGDNLCSNLVSVESEHDA